MGKTAELSLAKLFWPAAIFFTVLSAAAGVDIEIDGIAYVNVEVVREFPQSIQIRHRDGQTFIDRDKLSDENLSRLTGQSIITREQRTAPPVRDQKNPYEPPEPRISDACAHTFTGAGRPSAGLFRGLPTGREDVPSTNELMEHDVFLLVNRERKARQLAPYKWNENLARAARYHAADMVDGEYFNHDTHDRVKVEGRSVLRRVGKTERRIRAFWPEYSGENIAQGQPDAKTVMRSWMSSPGHRRNILSDSSTSLGVGFVHGVWVQNFGRDLPKESDAR